MAKQAFQLQDIVQLKSGSPKMIVQQSDMETTSCYYYNTVSGRFEEENIPTLYLKLAADHPQADTSDLADNHIEQYG